MEKVLFVDSYSPLLALYREEFTDDGYEVILAKNGKEALRKYRKEVPWVVVMDLHLPDMDGIELLNSILGMDSRASIIIHDAHRHQEDFRTWMAEAHVVKSFDFSELKGKVREVIANSAKRENKKSLKVASS
jgi:DNA-binding response OmpR family regulator